LKELFRCSDWFIIINFMIVINMYIAIILENFNQAHQEEEGGGGGGGGEEEPRQEHGTNVGEFEPAKSRNFVTLFWWSRRRSEF
jgi:hypothetical protein